MKPEPLTKDRIQEVFIKDDIDPSYVWTRTDVESAVSWLKTQLWDLPQGQREAIRKMIDEAFPQ